MQALTLAQTNVASGVVGRRHARAAVQAWIGEAVANIYEAE